MSKYSYKGRHRAPSEPSHTGRIAAATVIAGAMALFAAPPASAADAGVWDRIAQCESGGRWDINTGNGFHGGLQFSPTTWTGFGGGAFAPVAYKATKAQQIAIAVKVQAVQGWGAWPVCSVKAGAAGAPPAVNAEVKPPAPQVVQAKTAVLQTGNYTVLAGDTLSKIATKCGSTWQALFEKNRSRITNPNTIMPGWQLNL